MLTKKIISWSFSLVLAAAAVQAQNFESASNLPIIVELYTSQGCSSCPPADEFLGELTKDSDVLPLSFHVDYWNRLGWRDTFSSPAYTKRQRDYARRARRTTVYTPQMIIHGGEHAVGSDQDHVKKLIKEAKNANQSTVEFSGFSMQNGSMAAHENFGFVWAAEGELGVLMRDLLESDNLGVVYTGAEEDINSQISKLFQHYGSTDGLEMRTMGDAWGSQWHTLVDPESKAEEQTFGQLGVNQSFVHLTKSPVAGEWATATVGDDFRSGWDQTESLLFVRSLNKQFSKDFGDNIFVSAIKYKAVPETVTIRAGENRNEEITYHNVVTGLSETVVHQWPIALMADSNLCISDDERSVVLLQDGYSGVVIRVLHNPGFLKKCN